MSEPTDTRLFDAGERPSPKALFVRDLPDGETIETILLVKESAVAQRRSGEDYRKQKEQRAHDFRKISIIAIVTGGAFGVMRVSMTACATE